MTEPFSLVSWNIFQGLHHTSRRPSWKRNDKIESHLTSLDADVLVLPEMWHFSRPEATWAEDFAEAHGYELHQWVADRPSRPRELVPWRMVIMTRLAARRLDDAVLPQLRRFAARAIVRVELVGTGLTLGGAHMYGIHLFRQSPQAWLQERASFRDATKELDIIAGDMNIWGPIVRRDSPGKRAAATGRTYPARRPHSQIDHIMVSDRVDVLSSERLLGLGSDHLGFKVVLQRRS